MLAACLLMLSQAAAIAQEVATGPTAMQLFLQKWLGGALVGVIAFVGALIYFLVRKR